MAPGPRISAVVCTRDRLPYLERALGSLARQSLAADSFEILVVDNGSKDGTAAFLAREARRLPNLRPLCEERPGLSRARNEALVHARGALVAFLDDDAVAAPDWLARIEAAFLREGPELACLGGRTEAIWEAPRPEWLSDEALLALSIVDWLPEPGYLRPGQFPVGANIAFRTALLRELGGFPEHLGRVGDSLLSGEEVEVVQRLRARGQPPHYDPDVVVGHAVQRERLERSWFLRRAWWQGRSQARAFRGAGRPSRLARLRRCAGPALRLLRHPWLAAYLRARGDGAGAFDARCAALRRLGEIRELLAG